MNPSVLYMLIFRSARRGRACRTRQLRIHGSRAAHDSTRWGCEPQTLGPISQRQGFYKIGCWAPGRHSRISMWESRTSGTTSDRTTKSAWPSPRSTSGCQQLKTWGAKARVPSLGGGRGAVAEVPVHPLIAQLHSSTAPQLLYRKDRDQGLRDAAAHRHAEP